MNPSDIPRKACRVCGAVLNRYVDLDTGQVQYTHALHVERDGHDPEPVRLDEVDVRHVCDFCGDERIAYTVQTAPITSIADTSDGRLVQNFGTDWSVCFPCAGYAQAGDLDGLHQRLRQVGPPLDRLGDAAVRVMQRTVLDSLLPTWTVASIGRWPITPVPAAILPKVRDRLAALIAGPLDLPLGLGAQPVRGAVADSVATARLFWIDPEFTELADYAARSLPATRLNPADLPAPHGLLAWANPVRAHSGAPSSGGGAHAGLVAASWSSGPDGLRIVGYGSIGAGLPPSDLQRLREQLGWLVPRSHVHVPAADPIDADSPAAVVVATWLLIAQRLTETSPVLVDKTIRRAYQRAGRPAPEVRLVRIRGATSSARPATRPAPRGGGQQPTPHEYRWWVKAHWRQLAYGPGRALRRPFLVMPQLRGPDDKPIKASTVVRMLTAAPPHPDTTTPHGATQQPDR